MEDQLLPKPGNRIMVLGTAANSCRAGAKAVVEEVRNGEVLVTLDDLGTVRLSMATDSWHVMTMLEMGAELAQSVQECLREITGHEYWCCPADENDGGPLTVVVFYDEEKLKSYVESKLDEYDFLIGPDDRGFAWMFSTMTMIPGTMYRRDMSGEPDSWDVVEDARRFKTCANATIALAKDIVTGRANEAYDLAFQRGGLFATPITPTIDSMQ